MDRHNKHVHCYSGWPHGDLIACLLIPLEPDGEIEYGGRIYRPVLIWKGNCVVMQRDRIKAYVVTPSQPVPERLESRESELAGAGAGGRATA